MSTHRWLGLVLLSVLPILGAGGFFDTSAQVETRRGDLRLELRAPTRVFAFEPQTLEISLHSPNQPDEIFAEMRRQGITDLAAVRWAILESEGDISIVPHQRA